MEPSIKSVVQDLNVNPRLTFESKSITSQIPIINVFKSQSPGNFLVPCKDEWTDLRLDEQIYN